MTNLKKIQTYIARTKIKPETARRCCLTVEEVYLFYHMLQKDIGESLHCLFSYGMAKGYRAAKAEMKKRKDSESAISPP